VFVGGDAKRFHALVIDGLFLGAVEFGFLAMLVSECGRQIAFDVCATVTEGYDVIQVPRLTGADFAAADVASAILAVEDAQAHMRWRHGVI
jgi:hypothetical protein